MKYAEFEALQRFASQIVYFYEHEMENSCLIAISSFNWSFVMDYTVDFKDERPILIQALAKCVSDHDAENVADAFSDFVCSEIN